MEIIVASNNKGKIREIKAILGGEHSVVSMGEAGIDIDIDETGETFLENALIKAKTIFDLTKKPVLSDDSGLCVDALDGMPGIYSARYAGAHENADYHNNKLLLENLTGVASRAARFVSVVVLYYGEDKYIHTIGETKGEILPSEVGSEGFGYDPLFYSYELKKSFAEASLSEKNSISHRGKALEKLSSMLINSNVNK